VAIVVGCGPVGLAAATLLKVGGVRTVVASDPSPRRALATACGAALDGIETMARLVITGAALFSRVVVVGVCMGDDTVRPSMAINKEIDLRFVLGYTPLEFRDTLHPLADGKVGVTPLVTGVTGVSGVGDAFDVHGGAERHAKGACRPRACGQRDRQPLTFSSTTASACPTPMQIAARPQRSPPSRSRCASVPTTRAPEAPSG
jgi:threonine dehydrogenase-like Zn-dependent dehydrogenase